MGYNLERNPKALYRSFESENICLDFSEIEYRDLLFVLIGITLIFYDEVPHEVKSKSELAIEKVQFMLARNFVGSVQLFEKKSPSVSKENIKPISDSESSSKTQRIDRTIIPEELKKDLKCYGYSVEQDDISEQNKYEWAINYLSLEIGRPLEDQDLKSLTKSIEKMLDLKKLTIVFGCGNRLRDEIFISLGNILPNLDCLRSLELSFGWFNGLRNNHMKHLAEAISALPRLEYLKITNVWSLVSKIGMRYFQDSIKNLKYLKELDLRFIWCPNLSNEAIQALQETISDKRNLRELSVLTLEFASCAKISVQKMTELQLKLRSKALLKKTARIYVVPLYLGMT